MEDFTRELGERDCWGDSEACLHEQEVELLPVENFTWELRERDCWGFNHACTRELKAESLTMDTFARGLGERCDGRAPACT